MVLPHGRRVLFDGDNLPDDLMLEGVDLGEVDTPPERHVQLGAKKNHRRRTPMVWK
jgi:hypothetical protein